MTENCPFCEIDESRVVHRSPLWFTIKDGFPVNEGHMLVILRRHEPNLFGITPEEWMELAEMIWSVEQDLRVWYNPSGFNVGVNVGEAAGQTVPHLHVHVIPRYEGDCENPRGGVRKVKPPLVDY